MYFSISPLFIYFYIYFFYLRLEVGGWKKRRREEEKKKRISNNNYLNKPFAQSFFVCLTGIPKVVERCEFIICYDVEVILILQVYFK